LMARSKYILKLCLLGDGAVGKTSLVRRFVHEAFDDKYLMSFGTKVSKKTVDVGETSVDIMIWDILGQKTYESLHAAYYRGAVGALAVCDYTRRETMDSMSSWVSSFREVVGDMPAVILANKSDLEKAFSLNDLRAHTRSEGSDVLETSAKTGQNVDAAFELISKRMLEASR
jgi:small GTP-binding protein